MSPVLLKAPAYLLIITLAFVLKKKGFFHPGDYRVISNIVMNITLPAAVVTSFASLTLDSALFFMILIGLVCNLLMLAVGYLLSRKRSDATRALYMLNSPGYNIGAFTMPFVQSFVGPIGVAVTSLIDIGNAIMVAGGSYAFVSSLLKKNGGLTARSLLKILLKSMPFITYMLMMALALLKVKIPSFISNLTAPIGAANAFMAMLMVGLMFDIRANRSFIQKAAVVLTTRYLGAAILAVLFYKLSPFTLAIRQVMVIVFFSPPSALAPMFTERSGGDGALASLINSLSIAISLGIMTTLIAIMKIGQ